MSDILQFFLEGCGSGVFSWIRKKTWIRIEFFIAGRIGCGFSLGSDPKPIYLKSDPDPINLNSEPQPCFFL